MTGVRADRESLKLQQVGFRIALCGVRVLRRTHRSPSCMSASDSGPAAPTSMSADELVRIGFATVRNHPVLLKKLTLLRRKATPPREFRTLVRELRAFQAASGA